MVVKNHLELDYELKTEEGLRGIGFGVIVTIKNGEATFDSIDN